MQYYQVGQNKEKIQFSSKPTQLRKRQKEFVEMIGRVEMINVDKTKKKKDKKQVKQK